MNRRTAGTRIKRIVAGEPPSLSPETKEQIRLDIHELLAAKDYDSLRAYMKELTR